ncbi:MAG: SDR family NAD(P)-dependent oxidoreductase [Tetrasphaera sp.]
MSGQLDAPFTNQVAAVTGAGSGIGRQLAYGLARRGAQLALADVDEAGLAQTAARARAMGAEVTTTVLDVSNREGVAAYAQATREHFGVVHQVYNNAGIASGGRTISTSRMPNWTACSPSTCGASSTAPRSSCRT